MDTKRLWIVDPPKTAALRTEDGLSFLGRVREVFNVIRAGRPSDGNPAQPETLKDVPANKKNEAS